MLAAAEASTAGALGVNVSAAPFGSVRVSSVVGVVTARLTAPFVTLATMPKAPSTSMYPTEAQVAPVQRYLSTVPPRSELLARYRVSSDVPA